MQPESEQQKSATENMNNRNQLSSFVRTIQMSMGSVFIYTVNFFNKKKNHVNLKNMVIDYNVLQNTCTSCFITYSFTLEECAIVHFHDKK